MSIDYATSVLILNGAIVFFVGMLVGLPYGVLRARGGSEDALDNWRIAHVQNLQNGFLLLIAGVCTAHLDLSATLLTCMVYLLVVAAYCDMGAWLIRPITGNLGLVPSPPIANISAFALFNVTLLGQFAGIGLFIVGAWARWSGVSA
jgi:hypothetical protein